MDMYKTIKRQNGEAFAQTLRNHHAGILDHPGIDAVLRHAGRDAEPLLPYLVGLITPKEAAPRPDTLDPFVLLSRAGYDAFYADTLQLQNSIARYFRSGELLCTFNDNARYKAYHIVHAVRRDADTLRRDDFRGKERRQDEYGTSVISIQMLKSGKFISIKNRYNHTVSMSDHTFGSDPDNIIEGLSAALQDRFSVDFMGEGNNPLPDGFVLMDDKIFAYHEEQNTMYYGDQAWATEGRIYKVDRAGGNALFDGFLFDNAEKRLIRLDSRFQDSFAENFNRFYGGARGLHVRGGNLMLDEEVLIGAVRSQIRTLNLPAFTGMSNYCLFNRRGLTSISAPSVTVLGKEALKYGHALREVDMPQLAVIGRKCLFVLPVLERVNAPLLPGIGARVNARLAPAPAP